jgi:hypothetical protein
MEIAQGRITGAEVVNVNRHAQFMQARKNIQRGGWIVHDRAFIDFQFQHARSPDRYPKSGPPP